MSNHSDPSEYSHVPTPATSEHHPHQAYHLGMFPQLIYCPPLRRICPSHLVSMSLHDTHQHNNIHSNNSNVLPLSMITMEVPTSVAGLD